jgi:hypothetical protein
MNPVPVELAVEDRLSEAVLRRLLLYSGRDFAIGAVHRKGGFGYLRNKAPGWNRAAAGVPLVMLTDLDSRYGCPQALIDDWLKTPRHPNLLLRVAVREVESWLLADRPHLAAFLFVRDGLIPNNPDALPDPKAALIAVARRSRRRSIRDRVTPKPGSTAKIGPEYNDCLSEFVQSGWDVDAAAGASASLHRTVTRIRGFRPAWRPGA